MATSTNPLLLLHKQRVRDKIFTPTEQLQAEHQAARQQYASNMGQAGGSAVGHNGGTSSSISGGPGSIPTPDKAKEQQNMLIRLGLMGAGGLATGAATALGGGIAGTVVGIGSSLATNYLAPPTASAGAGGAVMGQVANAAGNVIGSSVAGASTGMISTAVPEVVAPPEIAPTVVAPPPPPIQNEAPTEAAADDGDNAAFFDARDGTEEDDEFSNQFGAHRVPEDEVARNAGITHGMHFAADSFNAARPDLSTNVTSSVGAHILDRRIPMPLGRKLLLGTVAAAGSALAFGVGGASGVPNSTSHLLTSLESVADTAQASASVAQHITQTHTLQLGNAAHLGNFQESSAHNVVQSAFNNLAGERSGDANQYGVRAPPPQQTSDDTEFQNIVEGDGVGSTDDQLDAMGNALKTTGTVLGALALAKGAKVVGNTVVNVANATIAAGKALANTVVTHKKKVIAGAAILGAGALAASSVAGLAGGAATGATNKRRNRKRQKTN